MSTTKGVSPLEPVLELSEIQGIVAPGFFKPHQTLLGIRMPKGTEPALKKLLKRWSEFITTGAETLADRRSFRSLRTEKHAKARRPKEQGTVLVAIGFSSTGLRRLTPGGADIPGEAFQRGLAARSALLGDPTKESAEGNPARWIVGGPDSPIDVLVVVAGDHRESVTAYAVKLEHELTEAGLQVPYNEAGDVREDTARGKEHFGFDDGISQPGMRGRASPRDDDFVTNRHVDPRSVPQAWLFGYPGQDLVWPGEFVLGYPRTSPDPLVPGPPCTLRPAWVKNGSFLVFRRLRQDVGLFWRTMRTLSEDLAKQPGFAGISAVELASRLVGRWPSGAPLNRTPLRDHEELGADPRANNYFYFDSDTPPLKLKGSFTDSFPMAKADPVGTGCPLGSHVRKLNVRDAASDMGGREATYNRRILRVGLPFGPSLLDPFAKDSADPAKGNRGLLFLSIQASIEDQFEFLMARWAGDPARPKMPGGHDMVIGQNTPVRRCSLFGKELQLAEVTVDKQWVIPTGGGYFFVPSISALREVIAA